MTITVQPQRASDLDDQDRACLRALYETAGDYEAQRSRHSLPVDGTCTWATDGEAFQAWETAGTPGLLWLTANPACGKSVFANGYAKKTQEAAPEALVCSFFFNHNGAHQALSALLHQILTRLPAAARFAREEFATKGPAFTSSTRVLWRIIRDICNNFIPANVQILFVIDALDDCEESSTHALIRELLSTFPDDGEGAAPRFKMLVTSRPTADLEAAFRHPCSITREKAEEKPELLNRDIDRVISFRIGELRSKKLLKRDDVSLLRSELQFRADGSFLYVDAVFKLLGERGCYASSGVRAAAEDAAEELKGTYERALATISRQSLGFFQCLLSSNWQPTLGEINVSLALGVEPIRSVRLLGLELEPDIEYTVKRLGGFFVRVINGKVSLVHKTAREFLQEQEAPGWDATSCSLTMAKRCLRILAAFHEPKPEESFDTPLAKAPFVEFHSYAARTWHEHTGLAGAHTELEPANFDSPEILELWDSIRLLCDVERGYLASWWPTFVRCGRKGEDKENSDFIRQGSAWYFTTPSPNGPHCREHLLHRAALKDKPDVIQALLAANPRQLSITDKDDQGNDVLTVAVRERHDNLITWLIREFDGAPFQREAALTAALSRRADKPLFRLLYPEYTMPANLEQMRAKTVVPRFVNCFWPRVPISTEDMDPEMVALLSDNLSFVCLWNYTKIVEELLRLGVSVNQKSGGMSPLLAAVFSGNFDLVYTLLDRGANPDELFSPEPSFLDPERKINVEDLDAHRGYLTAGGIDAFWQLLWKYIGAEALGITPLAAAAQSNQMDLASHLATRGSTANTINLAVRCSFPNCTPGTTASAAVREMAMRNLYFLRNPQALGRNICQEVIRDGPVGALSELIGYGCLELPPDAEAKTLLHYAAECGNVETAELLLREASHDTLWSRDAAGLTCLRAALRAGHADVGRRIHATDPDLQRLTTERRTLLHDAVYGGVNNGAKVVEDVLALILSDGLAIRETVDARDAEGRTALHHVTLATKEWEPRSADAKCGAVDVVRALVVGGAEYNLVDRDELTPLAFASRAVAEGMRGDPPAGVWVQAALVELETTLTRVPFWGDNRLDAGAIRGNYEQMLENQGQKPDDEGGDDWMFETEEEFDDGEDEDGDANIEESE